MLTEEQRLVLRVFILLSLLALAGMGLALFLAVLDALLEGALSPIDNVILLLIQPVRSLWLDVPAIFLHELFRLPYVVLLLSPFLLYLLITRRIRMLLSFSFVLGATLALVLLIKAILGRARPTEPLIEELGYSFPSGHAATSVVIGGLLAYLAWRYWVKSLPGRLLLVIFTAVLIGATGLSRVYLRVHYPSDVLAGWAIGAFILFGAIVLLDWLVRD